MPAAGRCRHDIGNIWTSMTETMSVRHVSALVVCLGLFGGCTTVKSSPPTSSVTASPRTGTAGIPGPPVDDARILHVLSRVSFGPRPGDVARVRALGLQGYLEQQLRPGGVDDHVTQTALVELPTLALAVPDLLRDYPRPMPLTPATQGQAGMSPAVPAMTTKRPALMLMELQAARMTRAVMSERQLQEVMVDFWFNHFNVFVYKADVQWYLTSFERDAIRPHALGKFPDLLHAVAHHPAMLQYLDNWVSQKPGGPGKPGLNENYARELMELHTLGVDGGYTQQDVTDVARAFTGWTIDKPREQGRFIFRPGMHDTGEKVILGHRLPPGAGVEDGERVLDLLAHHPATARFISTKLVRRFVADAPPPALVQRAAATFQQSGGDIVAVLRVIVTSPEFFADSARRAKIKKPSESVVSAVRALGGTVDTRGGLELARATARLGEPLYQSLPPTGYPDQAEAWINTGTLLSRMNFALTVAHRQVPGVVVDLDAVVAGVDRRKPERVLDRLLAVLVNNQVSPASRAVLTAQLQDPQILRLTGDDQRDLQWANTDVETLAALVLGSPDFQRR